MAASETYDEREQTLIDAAVEAFGEEHVLRDGVELQRRDGEPVLVDAASGHSLALGRETPPRLWARMERPAPCSSESSKTAKYARASRPRPAATRP